MGSLILDIDGVLIRDKALLGHVKRNCVRYVQHKMPEVKNPEFMNQVLYENFGHTGKGMRRAHKINTEDFNKFVYDKKVHDHLWTVLAGNEFQKDAEDIHSLIKEGWSVKLFSNSPLEWSLPVASAISDEVMVVYNDRLLKPDIEAYTQFSDKQKHVFVDDNLRNLMPAWWLLNWETVHFSDNKLAKCTTTLSSIQELAMYLRYVPRAR